MKSIVTLCFLLSSHIGFCLEPLPKAYLVSYGDSHSKIQMVQYFSFNCPHCLKLFRGNFKEIKSKFLDTKSCNWVFHPVPLDLLTVQAMACLEHLSDSEKRIFLEVLLDEIPIDDQTTATFLMQKAMEILKKPISDLNDKSFLTSTQAYQRAFEFLKQEEKIDAVPAISINDHLFLDEVPDFSFIDTKMEQMKEALKRGMDEI